ncbi:hypothetical protein [Aeropyrum globular virus 1]|uniref:hypothetical protein n=1 Tax=Aeropyrum globular virus 1 TaxID=1932713 RepID=UPI000C7F30FC|nr:hypothetical protein C1186_gp16 [Aeropyrum globular virus 1]BBC20942.1 hypothetical protein [Aeropyrum globular virus 1]
MVRESRVVGFRVSRAAWLLYNEALSYSDKEVLKYVVEGLILALARERMGGLPCGDILDKRLSASAIRFTGQGFVNFNVSVNVNENKNENRVNVDLAALAELVDRLYHIMKSNPSTPPLQLKLVEDIRRHLKTN